MKSNFDNLFKIYGFLKILVIVHRAHLLVRLCQTRSIGCPPDVENQTKNSLTSKLDVCFCPVFPAL